MKRSTKNTAKAANQSRLLKTSAVTEALSESISEAAATFKSLKITLLAIHSSPIKKAVGSFIYNFKYLPAVNQQLVLKGFKVKSKTYIFNSLTGEAQKGYIKQLVVDIRRQQLHIEQLGSFSGKLEVSGELKD